MWKSVPEGGWNSDDEDFDDVTTETSKEKLVDKTSGPKRSGDALKERDVSKPQ